MTMAEILRDQAGYATMMVGKWHLAKDSDGAEGPRHSWPCQRGFDRFYGVLDAFTNLHHPHRLVQDNHQVEVDQYPDDYYFTDDITDHAISMVRDAEDGEPGAAVLPLLRARCGARAACTPGPRTSRSTAAATTRAGTRCAPSGSLASRSSAWSARTSSSRRATPSATTTCRRGTTSRRASSACSPGTWRSTRAWSTTSTRTSGRLLAALDDLGELDNTIFVFTSDNGASREGEVSGTTAYYVHLLQGDDLDADLARIDEIGGPTTTPHYPRGWAMAGNTPFRLYKINTHQGGHSVPFIVSWPGGIADAAGEFRRQYQHVTDLLPTLLEIVGVERPATRDGVAARAAPGVELHAGARRRRRAEHAPRARRRDERPPRLLPRRLAAVTLHQA